jgi:hypothetical protein
MIAAPGAALMTFMMHSHGDLLSKLSTPQYLAEEVFALATGVLAAIAAFASVVPGYNRKLLAPPLVLLALWLGSLGVSGAHDWLRVDPDGFSFQLEWFCLPAIAIIGAVPAIAMAVMLRQGAPLTPRVSLALGGLAAAGLGNVGLCLIHHQFSGVLVLVWHMSAVVLLSMLGGCAGRYLLNWPSSLATARRDLAAR